MLRIVKSVTYFNARLIKPDGKLISIKNQKVIKNANNRIQVNKEIRVWFIIYLICSCFI